MRYWAICLLQFPGCHVINFEINLIFLIRPCFLYAQEVKTKIQISWERKELLRWKSIFEGLSLKQIKIFLRRWESDFNDILYAHIIYVQVAQKSETMLCQQRQYLTQKLRHAPKLCESQKNMLWQEKKLCDTQKRDPYWLCWICLVLHRK